LFSKFYNPVNCWFFMRNKRGLIGLIVLIIVLLVVGFFWFVRNFETSEDQVCGIDEECFEETCEVPEDCVKVQTTCCPCNMGGKELCVPKSEVEMYEKNLENCSETQLCSAVYNCEIESCGCVEGECSGE